MKNKRGFLLAEETLKIVIAVICLIFLVGFLAKLYYNSSQNKELEQAESSLEHLINEINAESDEVVIYNPGNPWRIISWFVEEEKPSKCYDWENCLCFCKGNKFWPEIINLENLKEDCEKKGVCRELPQKIEVENNGNFYIFIEKTPYTLMINDNKITLKK